MANIHTLAAVKIESAREINREILELCLSYVTSQEGKLLIKIGSRLGDFTNNLRSALNYVMKEFVQTKLEPQLSPSEFKKVKRNADFPCQVANLNLTGKTSFV